MSWEKRRWRGAPCWVNPRWWSDGLGHAFLGRLDRSDSTASALQTVAEGVHAPVCALSQMHSAQVVNAAQIPSPHQGPCQIQADALLITRRELQQGVQCFAVVTADCAPVIISGHQRIALVHAGWRGIAGGIVERALECVGSRAVEVVVGPCAGPSSYEVGAEVLEALGSRAIYRPSTSGRLLLSLPESIAGIARGLGAHVELLGDDTMSDPAYFSHRRGEKGRNVTLIGAAELLEPLFDRS
ncbi:MAG: polyphenol oxidase family protein [Bdellovibrionota bacterium]|nr:MAG: polyphenol oxidase family protein [Bdellovibrionota bacterium]